ncbi:uncharacterized protein LOC108704181 isoform X2 [Xenopus laevis]|uniref:Uncharacterized protein LOC108704181 isoform X2 n=1 Tax=Xenopus laevis TaxID=8355 RepID=A0A8J1LYD5_XENLA|nr:uncharacterized protein LOC108704181 isoform X2 [Xenopus laevis]
MWGTIMGDPGGVTVLIPFLRIQGILCLFLLPQTRAVLEVTAPSPHIAQKGSDILIPCTFQVNKFPADPKFLAIHWDFNGRRKLTYDNEVSTTDPRLSLNSTTAPWGEASLSVSNTQVSDGGRYTCTVTYSPEKQAKEIILTIQAPPRISISNKVVVENKESDLRASITGFYPLDLDVKWLRDGEILPGVTVNKPQRDPDGTHSTTSTVTIVPTKENRDQIFSIQVQHFSLIVPLQEDFQLIYAVAPFIKISHEPFYENKEQTLMCRVWGYYPEESIAVSWLANGSHVEASEIKRINSYVLESFFRFLPTAESQGMEISCVVEHQALTQPLVLKVPVQLTDAQGSITLIITTIIAAVVLMVVVVAILITKKKKICCFTTGDEEDVQGTELTTHWGSETDPFINSSSMENNMEHGASPKPGDIQLNTQGNFFLEVKDFYPKDIQVEWRGSPGTAGKEFVTLKSDLIYNRENENGTYNVTSTCVNVFNMSGPYTIEAKVRHTSLQSPKIITKKKANTSQDENLPTETSESGATDTGENGEQTGLVGTQIDKETQQFAPIEGNTADEGDQEPGCPKFSEIHLNPTGNFFLEVKDFYPKDIQVEWRGSPGSAGKEFVTLKSDLIYNRDNENGTYNVTSTCVNAQNVLNMSGLYTIEAQVRHTSLQSPIIITKKQAKPKGKIEESSEEPGKFIFTLERFYPRFIEIQWSSLGKRLNKMKKITENTDGTFTARSEVTFSEQELKSGIKVIWEHESLPKPECRHLPLTTNVSTSQDENLPTETSESGATETGENGEQTGLVGTQIDKETQQFAPIEGNTADEGDQEPEELSSDLTEDFQGLSISSTKSSDIVGK